MIRPVELNLSNLSRPKGWDIVNDSRMNRLGNSLVALSPELGHSTGASEKKLLIDFSSLGFSMSGSVCDLSVESIQQITDSLYDGQGYPNNIAASQ
jgi:hypothetical protein